MGDPTVTLTRYDGGWAQDDPDANFKALVAEYSQLDPTETLNGMSRALDLPAGAIARAVLARWAADGSAALLELGPSMVERLYEPIASAEQQEDDAARLAAYHQVRQMLEWLRSGA